MVKANYKYPYFTQTELMKHIAAMWNQSDEKKASDARRIAAADERKEAGTSAAASRCQASSPQGSSRPSELRPESSGLHTTQDAVQAALSVAVAMRGAQQSNPQPQPASDSKKQDKERQRKERQLQRKMDVARKALRTAMAAVEKYGVRCVCTPAPSPLASATLAWHTD